MTGAELLAARLAELGVRRVWGSALPGLDHDRAGLPLVPVADPDLAVLLADADGRIGEVDGRGRLGAAVLAGPILHLSSAPGGLAPLQTVGSVEEMLDVLVDPPGLLVPATTAIHLDLDLSTPVPEDTSAGVGPERRPVMTLDPSMAAMSITAVVGPGVVRASALAGLRSMSRAAGAGVLNTFGAKGVERWDSPWHFGTVGLQERDLELAGLDSVDIVVTSGLDEDELPGGRLPHHVVQDVHPGQLAALCQHWESSGEEPAERPGLFDALARVIRPMYEDDGAPLSPARASLHLSGALPDGGMAVVDPGIAGFWVARAFPTSIPNSVCVPATAAEGFAAAAALVCRMEGRAVLGVTDRRGGTSPVTEAVLSLAEELGHPVALQLWDDDDAPAWDSATTHVELLEDHLSPSASRIDVVPVEVTAAAALVEVAGPPVAWPDD